MDGFDKVNEIVTAAAKPAQTDTDNKDQNSGAGDSQNSQGDSKDSGNADQGTDKNSSSASDQQNNSGAGGNDQGAAADKQTAPNPLEDLLKETGFTSIDDLKKKLTATDDKTESPEEVKRKGEVYEANLNSFAVENEILTNDQLHELKSIKGKEDKDLVFEKYSGEVRDEIEENLKAEYEKEDKDPPTAKEIEEKIREAFDSEYPVESKNQKTKTRAENRLKKEAAEMRAPLESSLNKAKAQYDEVLALKNAMPEFQKTLTKMVTEAVPKEINFYEAKDGEEDIKIPVEISAKDQQEISDLLLKSFRTPENMALFRNGKAADIQAELKSQLDYILWQKFGDTGKTKMAEFFESRGRSKAKVGAENRFSENQGSNKQSDKQSQASAEKQILDSTRQKK